MNRIRLTLFILFAVWNAGAVHGEEKTKEERLAEANANYEVLNKDGNYKLIIPAAQKCVDLTLEVHGEKSQAYSIVLGNLGFAYQMVDELVKAEELLVKTLEIREGLTPPHPQLIAYAYGALGSLYMQGKIRDKSIACIKRCLEMLEAADPQDINVERTRGDLAMAYGFAKDNETALALHLQRLKNLENHPQKTAALILNAKYLLGCHYGNMKKYDDATKQFSDIIDHFEANPDPDSIVLDNAIYNLALVHRNKDDYETALSLFESLIKMRMGRLGVNHREVAPLLVTTAKAYEKRKEYHQAIPLAEHALEILKKEGTPSEVREAAQLIMSMHIDTEAPDRAVEVAKACLEMMEKRSGPESVDAVEGVFILARVHQTVKQYNSAAVRFEQAKEIMIKLNGPNEPAVATANERLAEVYTEMGETQKAEEMRKAAAEIQAKQPAQEK